jgi:ribosomal protein S14
MSIWHSRRRRKRATRCETAGAEEVILRGFGMAEKCAQEVTLKFFDRPHSLI